MVILGLSQYGLGIRKKNYHVKLNVNNEELLFGMIDSKDSDLLEI